MKRALPSSVQAGLALTGLLLCACPPPATPPPVGPRWAPGVTHPSERATFRGLLDVRGLIHAHSVYSHDACDGAPVLPDGTRDPVCFDDFRRGLCQSKHDFAFLTDHRESFDTTEFPDTLLYREDRGDVLVTHDGNPTANLVTCDDGGKALIMAGNEAGMLPVGLEGHAAPPGERGDLYGAQTAEAAQQMRDHGAVVLLAHPEDFTVEELLALPVDGFEMFNLHANTFLSAGVVLELILRWNEGDTGVPVPDLLILDAWTEDPRYLQRWGGVVATGRHIVTTMGTDCHRNTFSTILEDGERADSYRRMMIAFSNHLRIRPEADGTFDDRSLKEALASGRNWGAFEMMGYPVGFDSYAAKDDVVFEMGDDVPRGATFVVKKPSIKDLDPDREAPPITLRVLRADPLTESGWDVVGTSSAAELEVVLDQPGAYRAEVRMMPLHLREDMRDDAFRMLDEKIEAGIDYVWVYGGAVYVE